MCGIFGILGSIAETKLPNRGNADQAVPSEAVMGHRGPDAYRSFADTYGETDVYLEHNRLSIIGLGPQGHQPFCIDDGSIALTYNGEIYNYEALKAELAEEHDCRFETTTDTEVLVKAYKSWGIDRTLEELVGMFAFGVVDLNAGEAHVVRDHLGVKPVYYTDSDSVMFASEAKALFEKGGIEPRLDEGAVGEYLANFWVYEPDTLFQGVYKLEAGHYLTCDLETMMVEKTQYWDVNEDGSEPDLDDLDSDLAKVITDQLVSDVPLGMYLSGGVDSSIIAYHATEDGPITALNLRTGTEDEDGEYRNVERLAERRDIDVESFEPDASMIDIYREMVYYMDEPIADPAIIPAYLLAREAHDRDMKVMLSGMGGDELFGGYRRMRILSNLDWLQYAAPLVSVAHKLYPTRDSRHRRNLRRISNFLSNPSPTNYFALSYYFSKDEITSLLDDPSWYDRYSEKIEGFLDEREFVDDAQRFQYLDIRGYLSSHNLLYMDKASMAASVEVRVPLLDQRRMANYFNLPTAEKLDGGLKAPLKRHLSSILGSEFTDHGKQGFSFPFEDHLDSEPVRSELKEMLESERFAKILNVSEVERIIEEHRRGTADRAMQIWALYTLWLWLETFDVRVD